MTDAIIIRKLLPDGRSFTVAFETGSELPSQALLDEFAHVCQLILTTLPEGETADLHVELLNGVAK